MLKRLQSNDKLPTHIKQVSPPRYMKDRKTRKRRADAIYVRNDGYRQEENSLVLSKNLHVKWPRKGQPHHSTLKRASIDLGICNLATCAIEDSDKAYVYSGRAVLSDWRYWTKCIAETESGLKRANGRHSSKRLSALYRTRKRRLNHAVKSMLRDLYDRLETHEVTDLIIGDLKHIRDNANHGKVGNQKLHNFWPFAQIRQRIRELGEEYGIRVRFKSERGISKRCSICARTHANGGIRRGLYMCEKTGATMNAGVNGADEILYGRKVAAVSGSRPTAWPMLLRWDGRGWNRKNGMPAQRSGRSGRMDFRGGGPGCI